MMIVLQRDKIKNKSAFVVDIESEVKPFVAEMSDLCKGKIGRYSGGLAIAHCQVDAEKPLTFFVMKCGDAIINPTIIEVAEKTKTVRSEGCMSIAFFPPSPVVRYRRVKVRYVLLMKNGSIRNIEKWIEDDFAYIMQHEIDHFNLVYCDGKQ